MDLLDSFASTVIIDHHHLMDLHSIVFGEGILNDATSLALFQTILKEKVKLINIFLKKYYFFYYLKKLLNCPFKVAPYDEFI